MNRARHVAAWGLIGCAMLAIMPMGCANTLETATVRHGHANSGNRLPDITVERLKKCVVDYEPEFAWYRYANVDANVQVNEDGLIVNVTTEGIPASSPDFGACTRQVLRDMGVSASILRELKTKLEAKEAASHADSGGNLVGHPIVIVVAGVTLVFNDVVIQVAGITVLFTVMLALKDAVDAATKRRPRWMNECQRRLNECLASPLNDEYGHIIGTQRCGWCF